MDQVYKYALFKKLDEWKQRAIAAEGEQHFAVMDHDDVVSQIKQLEVDNKIFVDHVTKLKKRFNELEAQITSNESTIKFVSKYVGYRGSDPSKAPIPPECGGAMKRFKYDGGSNAICMMRRRRIRIRMMWRWSLTLLIFFLHMSLVSTVMKKMRRTQLVIRNKVGNGTSTLITNVKEIV